MLYVFYLITPADDGSCALDLEAYMEVDALLKKLLVFVVGAVFKKSMGEGLEELRKFVESSVGPEQVSA